MHDDPKQKETPDEDTYFEETVGMTGPGVGKDPVNGNLREDPELQETENDDISVITVRNEEVESDSD